MLFVAFFFTAGLLVFGALFGGMRIYSLVGPGPGPKAVIVDQLSLTHPNSAFIEAAASTLHQAGYRVYYIPGEQATVDVYRNLPSDDYDLIIWRAHAGRFQSPDGTLGDDVSVFTTEDYSKTKYVEEQREGRLKIALLNQRAEDERLFYKLFGITAEFVESSMRGDFDGATVILMGCDVLRADSLAKAFVQKGAKAVVGWNDFVSASHTDAATERLLEHLLIEELSVEQAVAQTTAELGPDPFYDSVLLSYPPEG